MEKNIFIKFLSTVMSFLIVIIVGFSSAVAYAASNDEEAVALQQVTVTGTVVDENGDPMPGVNIVVKGTLLGTFTDVNGKYTLSVPSGDAVLEFTFIGYATQEVKVGGRSVIDLAMTSQSTALEEIVVIGYGTAQRRDLTGAIASTNTETLEAQASKTVGELLRGNIAGLNVGGVATGAAGTDALSVRGKTTLSASSSPLLVVDGVIYDGSLSDINPIDIEKVDVLKDASSAAVYGSQAANGVVVITTKKGDTAKPTITFNANVGLAAPVHIPRPMNGEEFLDWRYDYFMGYHTAEWNAMYPELYKNPFELQSVNQLDWYNYTQKDPVSSVNDEQLKEQWVSRLGFRAPEVDCYMKGITTDWKDKVLQTGLQQDYTISLSNRTDLLNYYWSVGYTDREGIIVGDGYNNIRTRLNIDADVTKWLQVGINTSFALRDASAIGCDWGQMVALSPFCVSNLGNPEVSNYLQQNPTNDVSSHDPFYDKQYIDRLATNYTLSTNTFAIVKLPLGIEYQLNFTPYFRWYDYYNHVSSKHLDYEARGGSAQRNYSKTFNWAVDNILRWHRTIANNHRFEVTLLANAEKNQSWSTNASGTAFSPNDVLGYHRLQATTVPVVSSDDIYDTADALMGRLFYSFKDKYMVTLSVRRDGFSAFGANNKHAVFPAVALGWVLTEEKFMKNVDWFNYGKLRVSWGQNGNRGIGRYSALSSMTSGLHPYIGPSGNVYTTSQIYVSNMSNPSLKWERTESWNIGFDYGFLKDRLSGSIEAYKAKTLDLLVNRALPSITGFSSVTANLGQLDNWGLEFTVNGDIMKKTNFNWKATWIGTMNRRKLVKLYGDIDPETGKEPDDIGNGWFIGKDPDIVWAYERDGVWQLGEEEEASVYGCGPGDFHYVDQDGGGVLTNDDKRFLGYTTPRFRWSLRNEFNIYRNLQISFNLYSNMGYLRTFDRASNNNGFADRRSEYACIKRWTPDNPTNDWGRISSTNLGHNYTKVSFVRIDNLTFSYLAPASLRSKLSMQNLRLTFTVNNAGILTSNVYYKNWYDVENGSATSRTYTIGINFSL